MQKKTILSQEELEILKGECPVFPCHDCDAKTNCNEMQVLACEKHHNFVESFNKDYELLKIWSNVERARKIQEKIERLQESLGKIKSELPEGVSEII